MRHIEQPGPAHCERVQCVPATLRAVPVVVPAGVTVLQGLSDVVQAAGATGAVFALRGGGLCPLAYVMPALADSTDHVAYFSQRFESHGLAHLQSGCITLGQRDGSPTLHCHASWTDARGLHAGHLLPGECLVEEPVRLDAWLLGGAEFQAAFDEETNFTLLQVTGLAGTADGAPALAVRVRPNEDLCLALERMCAERGIRNARVRGGVGSLIGAVFEDGNVVEPFITEAYIQQGVIAPGAHGLPMAQLDVGLVAHTGEIAHGRLVRGQNPVLITFELVLEIEVDLRRSGTTHGDRAAIDERSSPPKSASMDRWRPA